LHVACKHGQAEVVRTLLAFRPTEQVLLEDDNLFLPLQRACERHYSEITALLLEHIPHEQLRSQDHFNNLLSVACSHPFGREGDPTGVVRQLLSLREYELSGEPKERLPIHIASRNGYADVVAMLLETDPMRQVMAEDPQGNLPLHLSSQFPTIVELLLQYEPMQQLFHKNSDGLIPIEYASVHDGREESVRLFFTHEVDEQFQSLVGTDRRGCGRFTQLLLEMLTDGTLSEDYLRDVARFTYIGCEGVADIVLSRRNIDRKKSARSVIPRD